MTTRMDVPTSVWNARMNLRLPTRGELNVMTRTSACGYCSAAHAPPAVQSEVQGGQQAMQNTEWCCSAAHAVPVGGNKSQSRSAEVKWEAASLCSCVTFTLAQQCSIGFAFVMLGNH